MGTKIKAASVPFENRTVSSGDIDIAKDQFELRWASQAEPQAISPSQSFANTEVGFQAAQAWLVPQDVVPATSLVVMEATSVYWEACALWFHTHQYPVSVVNPARVAAFAKTLMRRGKTDPLDARLLVQFALTLPPEQWTPPPLEMEALQQIMRQREAYGQLRSQVNNQLHALEHHAHPNLDVVASVRRTLVSPWTRKSTSWNSSLRPPCTGNLSGRRCSTAS